MVNDPRVGAALTPSAAVTVSPSAPAPVALHAPAPALAPLVAPVLAPLAAPAPAFVSDHVDGSAVASRPAELATVTGMPPELREHLMELEEWALGNKSEARNDALAFWSFKIPAIGASAGAGILAHFQLTTISLIAGTIASIAVIIDGVQPRGMLRNMHFRAYHDLRYLASRMVSEWRSRDPDRAENEIARQIIRTAEKERQRIAEYIRDAESALKFKE
jgi:hypothetical protein